MWNVKNNHRDYGILRKFGSGWRDWRTQANKSGTVIFRQRLCYRALDSETTTTSTRFSQYWVVLAREPASFWRENVLAVVILLRVLARFTGHHRLTDLLIQATLIAIFVKTFCRRNRENLALWKYLLFTCINMVWSWLIQKCRCRGWHGTRRWK